MLDFELVLAVALVLLYAAALAYAIFALYLYIRFERTELDRRVPVAMIAFAIHYVFVFAFPYIRGYVLLPTMLLFLMALALVLSIWFGSQAGTKAGSRIARGGAFALAAFVCRTGYEIYRWSWLAKSR